MYVTVPEIASATGTGFGDLWGSIMSTAQSIIPAHTVVGNLIGATGAKGSTPAQVRPITPLPTQSPGLLAPGGFLAQNQTLLLLGAAALVAVLVLSKRRK